MLRAFRRRVLDGEEPALACLPRFEEFAYAAGVLDLLFHPVEHLHTLPEVCTSKQEAVVLKRRIL